MPTEDRLCLSILAVTGMRLDEAALLEWEDVKEEEGTACFDLGRINKIVKNERSAREVPIPAELKLGEQGTGRLFRYRTDVNGKAQNAASKALMRYIRNIRDNPEDRRVTVHSLRHTFKDMLREEGIADDIQDFILGHKGSSVGSRYGSGPSLAAKARAISKTEFSF